MRLRALSRAVWRHRNWRAGRSLYRYYGILAEPLIYGASPSRIAADQFNSKLGRYQQEIAVEMQAVFDQHADLCAQLSCVELSPDHLVEG